ncbi:hypothetical protein ACXET9_07700 [Brachybacterium sp. DNPG3]
MSDTASAELLATLLMSIAICLVVVCPLAATVLAAPSERRRWGATAIGAGAIVGVAAGLVVVLFGAGSALSEQLRVWTTVSELVGAILAIICATLLLLRPHGSLLGIGAGVSGGLFLGFGMPLAPAIAAAGVTSELAWMMLAALVGPLAAVLLAAGAVALGGSFRALAIGIAAAALVAGVLLAVADVAQLRHLLSDAPALTMPLGVLVIAQPVVLVIATIVGAILLARAPHPEGDSEDDGEDDARPLPEMPEDPFAA